jgi:hypothetical protein
MTEDSIHLLAVRNLQNSMKLVAFRDIPCVQYRYEAAALLSPGYPPFLTRQENAIVDRDDNRKFSPFQHQERR